VVGSAALGTGFERRAAVLSLMLGDRRGTLKAENIARFLPRFAKLAAERIERALAQLAQRDFGAVAAELHTLSGEAAMLQVRAIAALAREGEDLARKGDSPGECERVLRALEAQIAELAR
jgi:HPt (histidine-containing phosphotransfer) domain-containing protein